MLRRSLAIALAFACANAAAGPVPPKAPPKLPPKATPLADRKLEKVEAARAGEKKGEPAKPEPAKADAAKPAQAAKPEPAKAAPPPVPAPPAPPPVAVRPPPPPHAPLAWPTAPKLGLAIERYTLPNGLRVVLVPEPSVPTVAVSVTYDVGSRDEVTGRTGFAHLFEHMMFQGSANVPRGAFDRLLSARGGSNNGTTNTDRTEYHEQLPSHELPLALWLEADRMKALAVSTENFENQRAVVKEEYRMSVSNRAYARSAMDLESKVYANYPAYAHDTIGSMEDLDAADFAWVEDFHRTHYGPNRAILTVAGALDLEEARALVEQYFAAIPASAAPAPEHAKGAEPPKASRTVRKDPLAKLTRIDDGWLMPACDADDRYALEVAAAILGDGESSRLERILVRERGVAVEVEAAVDDRRGPSLFQVSATLASGVNLARAEAALSAEIERLGNDGPTDAEVHKALTRLEAQLLHAVQSNLHRASVLSMHELRSGDARTYEAELARFCRVRRDHVKAAVKKWLTPKARVRVVTEPEASK